MRIRLALIIAVIAIAAVFLVFGGFAIMYFIILNLYSAVATSLISDDDWERQFAEIPVVARFIDLYPDYTTYHHGEYLGWRVNHYTAETSEGTAVLYIKKSATHSGAIILNMGCFPQTDSNNDPFTPLVVARDGVYTAKLDEAISALEALECG